MTLNNKILAYSEKVKESGKYDFNTCRTVYDYEIHVPSFWVSRTRNGLKTLCGIERQSYALNYYDDFEINCKVCNRRYKFLKIFYSMFGFFKK